jgi:hypothetical protein
MSAFHAFAARSTNPIDVVEQVAAGNDWTVDRCADDELHMVVGGSFTDLHICFNWREDLETLHLACTFDVKVPQRRHEEVCRLLNLINEQLYLGHFDLWRRDGSLLYRHGLTLAGGAVAADSQCEQLINLALQACERYFPAFQYVIWAGKAAEEAIQSSLMQTAGEA